MNSMFNQCKLLIIFGFLVSNVSAQGWLQLEDFPSTSRDDGTSFTINSTTYCGTGLNSAWTPTNDFHALDMSDDSWSSITGLPANEARQYANGFSSADRGYIFGGLNGTGYLNDLWEYDPITDTWAELNSMPSVGRSGASCFVMGDTAYILGGQTDLHPSIDEMWAYSMASDTWVQKNGMPDSLWRASSIALQGKGYLVFGRDNNGVYRNDMYEYTPTTDSWASLSSFPGVGRTYAGITILNNQMTIVAGRDSIGNSYNDMWNYAPITDSWSLSMNLPSDQRRGGICFYSPTSLYYTTGINLNDTRLTETWKFDLFLDINDLGQDLFAIYPNPTVEELFVNKMNNAELFNYQIVSAQGNIVLSGNSTNNAPIAVGSLETGHYMIVIHTQSTSGMKRFVVR